MAVGGWTPVSLPPIRRVRGRTLGFVGFGRIGSAVADRAVGLGLSIRVYDPYLPGPQDWEMDRTIEELLRKVDMVTLHAPLTAETEGILDQERIALLPPGAIVVNASRGGLLDLDAAVAAVRAGHLAGLAVDVTDPEPLPADHPARHTPGVIVTPHVGYFSVTSVEEAKRRSTGEVMRVLQGQEPSHSVG